MNLITGTVEEIFVEGGATKAKVKVGGVFIKVPLTLLMDARVGDEILVSAGVALSKLEPLRGKGEDCVSSDSR